MSETTEVHKCPVCEGSGWICDPLNLSMTTTSMTLCKSCNGTGIIITDTVTPFSGGSEQFDEVLEVDIGEIVFPYIGLDISEQSYIGLLRRYIGRDRVKISCRSGKIVIERREE